MRTTRAVAVLMACVLQSVPAGCRNRPLRGQGQSPAEGIIAHTPPPTTGALAATLTPGAEDPAGIPLIPGPGVRLLAPFARARTTRPALEEGVSLGPPGTERNGVKDVPARPTKTTPIAPSDPGVQPHVVAKVAPTEPALPPVPPTPTPVATAPLPPLVLPELPPTTARDLPPVSRPEQPPVPATTPAPPGPRLPDLSEVRGSGAAFDHAPDYRWIKGVVERTSQSVRVRYAPPDRVDPHGGSVTLLPGPLVDGLRDGAQVALEGTLRSPDRHAVAPPYQVLAVLSDPR